MRLTAPTVATLVATAAAASDKRTFAVLRHHGNSPLMTSRIDPIVDPGKVSTHVHSVFGGSNFGMNTTGEDLLQSKCTTALIKGDMSSYWFPSLYFEDPKDGHFEPVDVFYMNAYYFFEATNDKVVSFPVGLKMLSGDPQKRDPPNKDGTLNLNPSKGTVNPLQWTCPRSGYSPPSWPAGSDGTKAGIQDPGSTSVGTGFPFADCDGYASPLRMDLHFPSCYNPKAGLENYETNTVFPTDNGNGKQDCPKGYIHVPHLFYEVYWNTPAFKDRWTPNSGSQPFVLSNGDRTGYSGHADFIAAWDEELLQHIIDTCDAGSVGMDKCSGLKGLNDQQPACTASSPLKERIGGKLTKLPGDNPVSGWGRGPAPDHHPKPDPKPDPKPSYNGKPNPGAAPTGNSNVMAQPSAPVPESSQATERADDSAAARSTSTVWETVTQWATVTTYEEPTPAPQAKRHLRQHLHGRRRGAAL